MEINRKMAKEIKIYHSSPISLFLLIIATFFWSCDSNNEASPNSSIETDDTTILVTDTTLIMDTTDIVDTMVLNAPIIQTPSPVIHLADNLDEQDQLGWCIDTRGNGFNEELHAHSCKASGGDVQFIYNEETRQICSAEFTGFCIEMSGGAVEGMSLSLVESDIDSPQQKFIYNKESGEFNPEEDTNLCLAVGETSAAAGIYMFRTLTLELSSEKEEEFKKWIIVE